MSPSCCMASCSGLVCTARRVGADAIQRLGKVGHHADSSSCANPMLPISSTSGATSRTSKLAEADGLSSMIRCEPSIMPTPSCCAAAARLRLMVPDSSAPPVIEPISTGARSRVPRNSVDRSTLSRSVWVSALYGQPVALQAGGHRLVLDGLGQAHVDVAPFAALHVGTGPPGSASPASPLTQWRGDRRSVDRDRGHRRSARRCARRRPGAVPAPTDQPVVLRHCHSRRPLRRIYRLFRHHVRQRQRSRAAEAPSGSTPAGCPPSAMMPPFRATRRSGRSPTCGCPSRAGPSRPSRRR